MNNTKCGTVALIGEPNAGKSTLLNRLIGQKISIVTPKVQTTRTTIRGIVNIDQSQMIFIDTPGIFKAGKKLERAIVRSAWSGLEEADIICMLFDAKKPISENIEHIIKTLKNNSNKHFIAVINKIDVVDKKSLLALTETINNFNIFNKIFMISALGGTGVLDMVNHLIVNTPENPWSYNNDELTDTSTREIAQEITREQLFLQLNKEIPYSLKVETDQWEEKEDGSTLIHQSIFVMKQSQKAIVLGNKGTKIKEVGRKARHEISQLLDNTPVHLFLHVKVREDWIDRDY